MDQCLKKTPCLHVRRISIDHGLGARRRCEWVTAPFITGWICHPFCYGYGGWMVSCLWLYNDGNLGGKLVLVCCSNKTRQKKKVVIRGQGSSGIYAWREQLACTYYSTHARNECMHVAHPFCFVGYAREYVYRQARTELQQYSSLFWSSGKKSASFRSGLCRTWHPLLSVRLVLASCKRHHCAIIQVSLSLAMKDSSVLYCVHVDQ